LVSFLKPEVDSVGAVVDGRLERWQAAGRANKMGSGGHGIKVAERRCSLAKRHRKVIDTGQSQCPKWFMQRDAPGRGQPYTPKNRG
jgi:hypothetical protein